MEENIIAIKHKNDLAEIIVNLKTNVLNKNTLRSYRRAIVDFFGEECVENITVQQLQSVTVDMANQWASKLLEQGMAQTSINARLAGMKNLYDYLKRHEVGIMSYNPFDPNEGCIRFKNAVKNYSPKIALTKEQVGEMLNCAKNHKGILGTRDYLIIFLLATTGMRREELTSLKFSDLKKVDGRTFFEVVGKGDKFRLLEVAKEIGSMVLSYADTRGLAHDEDKYIFVSHSSNSQPEMKLSTTSVDNLVKKVAKEAGIDPKTVSPHTLRHTYATLVYESHLADPHALQDLMGHTNFSTTKRYIHASQMVSNSPANELAGMFVK